MASHSREDVARLGMDSEEGAAIDAPEVTVLLPVPCPRSGGGSCSCR